MKKKTIFLLIAATILLINCASKKNTLQTDYDVKVDFNSYKTFAILPWYSGNSEYVGPQAQNALQEMIASKLEKQGYTRVTKNADMAVSLLVLLDEKRDATAYTRYYNTGGFGYYYGFGYGLQSTTYYKKRDYLEGTIIIDLFDQKEKTLIWQGVSIQEIVEEPAQRRRQVDAAINKLFRDFPR